MKRFTCLFRELDFRLFANSASPPYYIERLKERVRRDYEQNRDTLVWKRTAPGDIADRSLNVVPGNVELLKKVCKKEA